MKKLLLLLTLALCSAPPLLRADTVLVFNEIMYHPAVNETNLEWVEFRNQLAVNLDISGWAVEGGVDFTFPQNTVVPGGGFIVVALSPPALQTLTGLTGIRGPFTGRLSNNGETLRLVNNSHRVVDEVSYGVEGDWPVGPDGSGFSLAKQDRDSASGPAQNWRASDEVGGTPAADNFPFFNSLLAPTPTVLVATESTWRFQDTGLDPGGSWTTAAYNDSNWATNQAWFYRGSITAGEVRPIPTVFNTGVGANRQTLPATSADPHYTITAAAQGPVGGPAMVIEGHPAWLGNDTESSWIGVANPGSGNISQGNYFYLTRFDLTGFLLGTVQLNVGVAADDRLTALMLNGISTGNSSVGFTSFTEFVLNSGFVGGTNALEFRCANDSTTPNPGGFRAKLQGTGLRVLTNTPVAASATHYFRSKFNFAGDLEHTELSLNLIADDGAVIYLNGMEVYRHNMPGGAVGHTTAAASEVGSPTATGLVVIPATSLISGMNVLAAEVHQAANDGGDMVFGAQLVATPQATPPIRLALNELSASTNATFWIELLNYGETPIDLEGFSIVRDGVTNGSYIFPSPMMLAPSAYLAISNAALGFHPTSSDKIYLLSPAGERLLDAVVVKKAARARATPGTGRWLVPNAGTPGSANTFQLRTELVINEIMYHHQLLPGTNGSVPQPSPEGWVEVYNRSGAPIDLTGWQLTGGIGYNFLPGQSIPALGYLVIANDAVTLSSRFPAATIIGNFNRSLSHRSDLVVLEDPSGNPADEVRYHDRGRWPEYSDGGGSSLELRHPDADNAQGESWAASLEGANLPWVTYSYRAVAANVLGPTQWNDFILGLLSAGECLIDDISVVEAPTNGPIQFVANGNFENGMTGWRVLGTHRHSRVESEPGNPGNHVLHLVATGPQEHMHNHIETTYTASRAVANGRLYEISFRAKWLAGGNLLNTRLYFNRVARTTVLPTPQLNGTPGVQNSRYEANVGPSFSGLTHEPVVPPVGTPVTVSAFVSDSAGLGPVTVWWSVNGGTWSNAPMSLGSDGKFAGTIPGLNAGAVVQFYVRAQDSLGAVATMPAGGTNSGALFAVADGQANLAAGHNLRIVMTPGNSDLLHALTNVMSNDGLPGTVIYDETHAYYDVGVRLKGSERGRYNDVRVSFHLTFPPDDLFRGVHPVMLVDRSGAGDSAVNRQQEILVRHVLLSAGDIPGIYADLARVIAPRAAHTGSAILAPRHEDEFIETAYQNGGDGELYELELIYYPTTTNAFGYKLPTPDSVTGADFANWGNDKETYRYNFIKKNQRDIDDYSRFMRFAQGMDLTGNALDDHARLTMDVDEWMRSFALLALCGINDMYTYGNNHNLMMYVRPADQRMLAIPWDMDFSFSRAATSGLYGDQNLQKVILLPANFRLYAAHLLDLMNTVYSSAYMGPWVSHYNSFLPGQTFAPVLTYIDQRASSVRGQLNGLGGATPFTVSGTNQFTINSNLVVLTGTAPFEAATIRVNGAEYPVTWTTLTAWRLLVPVSAPSNFLAVVGYDVRGNPINAFSNAVIVHFTGSTVAPEGNLVINEIMYQPLTPGATFVELFNRAPNFAFDLSNYRLNGIDYTFPPGSVILPRGFVVLAQDASAYGTAYPTNDPLDDFPGRLDPDGETLSLFAPGALPGVEVLIDQVRYENTAPWALGAAGSGASLQLIDAAQDNSRASNWSDGAGWRYFSFTGVPGANQLFLFLSSAGDLYIDNVSFVTGTVAEAGINLVANGSFEAPFVPSWSASGNHSGSGISQTNSFAGTGSLHLVASGAGGGAAAVRQTVGGVTASGTYTLSFWFLSTGNGSTLTARFGSNFRPDVDVRPARFSPGTPNTGVASLIPYPDLWLNEVQPNNFNGLADAAGDRDPWVELYNGGATSISLQDFALANNYSNAAPWYFPSNASIAPGEYKLVWLDAEPGETTPGELHASFTIHSATGSVALTRLLEGTPQVVDYLNYSGVGAALSYGDLPDGQPFHRQIQYQPTPGTTNIGRAINLFINEWLALNTNNITDPADEQFTDWFEIHNPTTNEVDIGGFYLTDNNNTAKFQVPPGYIVPARGYLLVWADEESSQNNSNSLDLHVNFKLDADGELIGLYTPERNLVDKIVFGVQNGDVSGGRFPDATTNLFAMTTPTPRSANTLGGANTAPTLQPINNATITLGQTLSFTAMAADAESPPQSLAFSLTGAASASIHATSGVFSWTPSTVPTPSTHNFMVTVADNGSPIMSASQNFSVTVVAPPQVSVTRDGANLSLTFATVPGKTYRVQFKNDLNEQEWMSMVPDRMATSETLTVTDNLTGQSQRFYRILLVD